MDYEKLHKDTIVKLQQMVNSGKITVETACGICADFIPESEDERIRYYLINFVKINDGINLPPDDAKKALAWLEKQGEQKPKFRVGDTIKCKHDDRQFTIKSVDSDKGTYTYTQEGCGNDIDYADEEFELVEQKPADNVEPKFHEGDWVIDKQDIVHQIANVIENVTYHTYCYDIVGGGYFNDNTEGVRLWTIQDAKDGDLLVSEYPLCGLDTWYCIFKSLDGDESMTVYCYLARDGRFETKKELCFDKDPYNTKPATKEQRDTLMKAMTDAGYTFDFEKKELKKVEQKPAWSEEDIELLDNTIKFIEDRVAATSPSLRTYSPTLTGKEIPFLKALKDRVQPKQEWSEEDKWMLQNILECLRHGWKKLPTDILKYESWLKSLRPQSQWKASDEQMQELHNVFNDTSAGWDDNVIE